MFQEKFITRLSDMLDKHTREFVKEVRYSPDEGEYPAIPTSIEILYQQYNQLRDYFYEKPKSLMVMDIGSGVGNALAAMHTIAIADGFTSTVLVGVEKHMELCRHSSEYMDFYGVPPMNRHIHLLDVVTSDEETMRMLVEKHAFEPNATIGQNICMISRLFRDGESQEMIEDRMFRLMPIGTLFITSGHMGQFNNEEFFKEQYGVTQISKYLFKKHGKPVLRRQNREIRE